MTLKDLYSYSISRLNSQHIEDSAFEIKLLSEKFLSISYEEVIINPEKELDNEKVNTFLSCLERRVKGEPIQYILGSWEFMGFEFSVGEGVLIPRPETEILVEYTAEKLKNTQSPVVFDLCSGTGCIGLSIKKLLPTARVFMVEISDKALCYLNKNRTSLGLAKETCVIKGDVLKGYEAFSMLPQPDVIVSNPPYISCGEIPSLQKEVQFEPKAALDGGKDGLDFYRALASKWIPFLKNDGFIAVECGENQADDISAMFMKYLNETEILNDYANIQRVVIGHSSL